MFKRDSYLGPIDRLARLANKAEWRWHREFLKHGVNDPRTKAADRRQARLMIAYLRATQVLTR